MSYDRVLEAYAVAWGPPTGVREFSNLGLRVDVCNGTSGRIPRV